ncbi:MAG TPA: alpha/beta hydrolase [Ktedonobacterales bacterium]
MLEVPPVVGPPSPIPSTPPPLLVCEESHDPSALHLAPDSLAAPNARFDISGPPGAPTIVFVHASGWTRKMWLPQMERLADMFRVVALDLPGHGRHAARPFRIAAALHEIEAAIQHAGGGPALLVGLSLGGYVSMAFARRHPERTAGLVLAGCSVSFEGTLGLLTRVSATVYAAAMRLGGRRLLLPRYVRREHAVLRREHPAEYAQAQIEAGLYPATWGRALLEVAGHDFRGLLRAYPRPVLILNGERDFWNRRTERAHIGATRHGRLEVIAGAAHMCSRENPDAFTAAVRRFAAVLPWPGALASQAQRLATEIATVPAGVRAIAKSAHVGWTQAPIVKP